MASLASNKDLTTVSFFGSEACSIHCQFNGNDHTIILKEKDEGKEKYIERWRSHHPTYNTNSSSHLNIFTTLQLICLIEIWNRSSNRTYESPNKIKTWQCLNIHIFAKWTRILSWPHVYSPFNMVMPHSAKENKRLRFFIDLKLPFCLYLIPNLQSLPSHTQKKRTD